MFGEEEGSAMIWWSKAKNGQQNVSIMEKRCEFIHDMDDCWSNQVYFTCQDVLDPMISESS